MEKTGKDFEERAEEATEAPGEGQGQSGEENDDGQSDSAAK